MGRSFLPSRLIFPLMTLPELRRLCALGDFRTGLARVCEFGGERRAAIMRAEAVWWRCHRRIVADYLLAAGEAVFHILGPGNIPEASMTSAARPVPEGGLIYP